MRQKRRRKLEIQKKKREAAKKKEEEEKKPKTIEEILPEIDDTVQPKNPNVPLLVADIGDEVSEKFKTSCKVD